MTSNRTHRPRRAVRASAIAATVVSSLTVSTIYATRASAETPSLRTVNSTELASQAGNALNAYHAWVRSKQPMAWVEFVAQRDTLAFDTSSALGTDGGALAQEWAASPVENQVIVVAALSQLGVKYRMNAMSPNKAFDCSGFTKWAYEQAGVELPRVSWDQIRSANDIERSAALPGDLVQYPGHIGLYLGQDGFIDSPNTGNVIRVHGMPNKSSLRFGDATPNS